MKNMTQDNIFIHYSNNKNAKKDIWFIHGLGESGQYMTPIFETKIAERYNIYIPDFPGFGKSPYQIHKVTIEETIEVLKKLIHTLSKNNDIVLMTHSLGSIMGTLLCENLEQIKLFINIEGIITEDKNRFSSSVDQFEKPEDFKKFIEDNLAIKKSENEIFQHYFDQIQLSDARSLAAWSQGAKTWTKDSKIGDKYKNLPCDSIYIYGDQSPLKQDRDYIAKSGCKTHNLGHYGHWPMIECPNLFYQLLEEIL